MLLEAMLLKGMNTPESDWDQWARLVSHETAQRWLRILDKGRSPWPALVPPPGGVDADPELVRMREGLRKRVAEL